MDTNLIYAKTPAGDEAVRQSTRVVQRNLRMVLVQVDGNMSVQELSVKIGNPRLVEAALRELEEGGFIVRTELDAAARAGSMADRQVEGMPSEPSQPMSQFSVFGAKPGSQAAFSERPSAASHFSSFGKPILPASGGRASGFKPSMMPPHFQTASEDVEALPRRGRLSVRRVGLLVLAVLLLVLGTAFFYPYGRFKPEIEALASAYLGNPVKVGAIGLSVYPTPHLRLTDVTLGAGKEGRIAQIRVGSPFALLTGSHAVSQIEVVDARLSPKLLVSMPFFQVKERARSELRVRKIRFDHLELAVGEGLSLSDFYGELVFRESGALEKAIFENDERSLRIDAQASPLGVALNIDGRSWKPGGSMATFSSLQAKGILQAERLLVQDIDTTFLGGVLRGNWLIDWGHGLAMAGDGTLSRIDVRKVSAAFAPSLKIEGELGGVFKLRSTGATWESLWRGADVVLNAEITRGTLLGVDLGEAARRSGISDVRGGTTKFDALRATVNVTPKQIFSKDVRLDAGMLTASGQFAADRDGAVEGGGIVSLQSSVSRTSLPVRIFGTLPDLTVSGRK